MENGTGTAVARVSGSEVALGGTAETALNAFSSDSAFNAGIRMAKALASSSLVPTTYKDNLGNCLIAIELANRTRASVLMVMQNLDVIHGRPGWRSQFLIATVNASGRFTPLRFRWQGEEGSDAWGCRAVATDRESGYECVGSLVTLKMAKDEGWYSRNGSKYKTMPEQMLMYRAASFWTRIYAPELSLGMMTAEELEDLPVPTVVHAQDISTALHAEDPPAPTRQDTGAPPVIVAQEVTEDTPPEGPASWSPPRGAKEAYERYLAALQANGCGEQDRAAFEARLHRESLVSAPTHQGWAKLDFLSATAELERSRQADEGGER